MPPRDVVDPKTPPRFQAPTCPPDGVDQPLKSTPSNRGTASDAEFLRNVRVNDIKETILHDIRKHDTCTVEELLSFFLSLCLSEGYKDNPPSDLLNQCVKAVLPICNNWRSGDKDASGLRGYLKEYCEKTAYEKEQYQPFVFAFNHAFQALEDIKHPSLRGPSEFKVLFHHNDPKPIVGKHKGEVNERKPDVVLVSLNSARRAFEENDTATWAEYALNTAGEPPKNNFEWKDTLNNVEFKFIGKRTMHSPPEVYQNTPLPPTHPQPISAIESESNDVYATETDPSLEPHGSTSIGSTDAISTSLRRSDRLVKTPGGQGVSSNTSRSSQKRKRNEDTEGSNKKSKQSTSKEKVAAMVQSAYYAAERMSHSYRISHTINLVIIGDVAYIWWYDNQGAIQSNGINFVQDLPYFLVLLLCFQQFTLENWGVISAFKPSTEGSHTFSFPAQPNVSPIKVDIPNVKLIHEHFGIVGRATQMLTVKSHSSHPRNANSTLTDTELVMKIYYPEKSRVAEDTIIGQAGVLGEQNDNIKGHIPDLIASYDFAECSTDRIRSALGIKSDGERILRVLLFRKLYPITDLVGEEFWRVFWECFRCHRHLWVGGIEHNDISVRNLMYDKLSDNSGILNDYDLAHVHGHPKPSGTERTGTMPFMALDLLTEEAWDGKVERLYRHDCESFVWVLLWICCRYDNGKEIDNPPLSRFITRSYEQCRVNKIATMVETVKLSATLSYRNYLQVVIELLDWILEHRKQRNRKQSLPELSIEEVLQNYDEALTSKGFAVILQ